MTPFFYLLTQPWQFFCELAVDGQLLFKPSYLLLQVLDLLALQADRIVLVRLPSLLVLS